MCLLMSKRCLEGHGMEIPERPVLEAVFVLGNVCTQGENYALPSHRPKAFLR